MRGIRRSRLTRSCLRSRGLFLEYMEKNPPVEDVAEELQGLREVEV